MLLDRKALLSRILHELKSPRGDMQVDIENIEGILGPLQRDKSEERRHQLNDLRRKKLFVQAEKVKMQGQELKYPTRLATPLRPLSILRNTPSEITA